MPEKRAATRALWRDSAARIRVFDGTQPILTQVPPMAPLAISATCCALIGGGDRSRKASGARTDDDEIAGAAIACRCPARGRRACGVMRCIQTGKARPKQGPASFQPFLYRQPESGLVRGSLAAP